MLRPAGACLRRERVTGVEGGVRARLPTSLSILLHSLLVTSAISVRVSCDYWEKPECISTDTHS